MNQGGSPLITRSRLSKEPGPPLSATYASRNGVPLEVVSKVILRHQDLKTTQIYLGKISDTEAIRWTGQSTREIASFNITNWNVEVFGVHKS